ncbi:MAG: hypothetical protein CVU41_12565 [Chloroflexi bacterium HGW-Chloroflexi-3]|nr:MAG: hypothetical protein CVU41_12565 [Chloroflexi bacterium HGW-Chloroflexi-3]
MSEICSFCGAATDVDLTCQDRFDEFPALEFTNPAYGKVHLLTVSCFMIQHQRYSDPALIWMQEKLSDVLEKGVSPGEIRVQMSSDVDQGKRDWKIERQPDERKLPHINWSITIADVYPHKDDPVSYCAWVERWARATLEELSY